MKTAVFLLAFIAARLAVHASGIVDNQPLPDAAELKKRAVANMKASEKALEKYSCMVNGEFDELNANGTVKHHGSRLEERFFVNGIEIDHVLARDGKDLTGVAAKKEQERVNREVKKYLDAREVQKLQAEDDKQMDMLLRAVQLTNGRREMRDGRTTLVFDLTGDPNFHPKKMEERFAQALTGRIWIDEQTGMPVEVRFETVRDVKIAGGLIASLHKGFELHVIQQREPDGVWITKTIEGSGDARAALFLHPRFRFREQLDRCHLFSVEANQSVRSPEPASASPLSKP